MKKLAILMLALSFAACQSEKKASDQEDSTGLSNLEMNSTSNLAFKYDSLKIFSKPNPAAKTKSTDTTYVRIVYPSFPNQKLNQLLEQKTIAAIQNPDDKKVETYQQVADAFIKDYENLRDTEGTVAAWFLDAETKVLTDQPDYIGLEYSLVNYAGGAHPNSNMIYWNLNPKTLQEITLESLINEGSMPQLVTIAEKIFRKNEKLSPTASLKDTYFFENDKFNLNRNFTITKEGLKFLYNPYEIKAYAYGSTELIIPFSDLKTIARPNTLLSPTK
ncbi:DUF3298 and DUF4163 domain-containing protein [Pedobacter gandavensis]|uniref:DUF3298 domain-containing protein n=1 Tax=Pedobacter gandavensis TaxID=2679963 RepID=A0ABR6EUT5_9SPHI|nr:DUF3298 and DUF4163 domain-containing protein [Pedobacter gandavensis]MBB2149004.1 DUF3298 domain-containing protein [Pedobacter gandavensis]